MKLAALLLLISGWAIVVAALPLLRGLTQEAVFALAGMGVEILGLVLLVRAHLPSHGEEGEGTER